MLMLRCGLRVEEVAQLTLGALDLPRSQLFVYHGKGAKDRVVYLSHDAQQALLEYLKSRSFLRAKRLFWWIRAAARESHLGARYSETHGAVMHAKQGLKVCCHQLRHTMACQLLHADADLVTIQDLLGHSRIKTTQRYCQVSNLKVQRD